jgi:hypothetical protein
MVLQEYNLFSRKIYSFYSYFKAHYSFYTLLSATYKKRGDFNLTYYGTKSIVYQYYVKAGKILLNDFNTK